MFPIQHTPVGLEVMDFVPQMEGEEQASAGASDGSAQAARLLGVVDYPLKPEGIKAAKAISLALNAEVEGRVISTFVGSADVQCITAKAGELVGNVMLEALPAFVRATGGQVIDCFAVADRGRRSAALKEVMVDGKARKILRTGLMCIIMPDQRYVVGVVHEDDPRIPTPYTIQISAARSSSEFNLKWRQYAAEHGYLKNRTFFADGELIVPARKYTWGDVFVEDSVKSLLRSHVEIFLKNRSALQDLGVKSRRGVILSGPPGTGKTLIGRVLASQCEATFIWLRPNDVQQMFSLDPVMDVARLLAPSVLFFEDLDLVAEDRDHQTSSSLGDLMNQIDGVINNGSVVTLATTNRLEVVEGALRNRPGRFDRVVKVLEMGRGCRRKFLDQLFAKVTISAENLHTLTLQTEGCTGAQIEEIASSACLLALEKRPQAVPTVITWAEIEQVLRELVPPQKAGIGYVTPQSA